LLAYLRYAHSGAGGGWPAFVRLPSPHGFDGTSRRGKRASRITFHGSLDTRHSTLFYGLAFVLFLGALLAKTTAFSLPAAILLLGWWPCGQIR